MEYVARPNTWCADIEPDKKLHFVASGECRCPDLYLITGIRRSLRLTRLGRFACFGGVAPSHNNKMKLMTVVSKRLVCVADLIRPSRLSVSFFLSSTRTGSQTGIGIPRQKSS
nr:hypothetical protein CFP56_50785 [Quercus suber]